MKTALKAALDAVIAVGFLALLEPKLGPLPFHEWGGLAVCVFFLVHKAFNLAWIKSIAGRFFSPGLPVRTRINFLLDTLLLAGFSAITLSGLAIAKTIDTSWLFPGDAGFVWRRIHGFASYLMLATAGVHLGLHWDWIAARFRKPAAISRTDAACILVKEVSDEK